MLELHQRVGGGAERGELLVEPPQRRSGLGILLAQPLHEIHHEGGRQAGGLEPLEGEGAAGPPAEPEQLVGERVGAEARGPAVHDALGQPAEVLHEHEADRNRDGPELADGQRLHALESAHEALQRLGLHAAVGVGDELPGQAEDARISLQRLLRELGKLAVKSAREVLANLPHGLVRDVEIVDEPFRGGRERPFFPDHRRDLSIALQQDAAAVPRPRREEAPGGAAGQDRPSRHALRELLQALGAQELGPDRLLGLA